MPTDLASAFPLVFGSGNPLCNNRKSLGIIILGGMHASAVIGTLIAPSFYSLVQILKEKLQGEATKSQPTDFTN
jgi:multidrug efflux pump subunit AcrB